MGLNKTRLLFIIILVEGYVVLASELLAIRQLVPFVGSGTEVVSIVISAILLPLAIGYHVGGRSFKRAYARARIHRHHQMSVRKLLLRNIVTTLFILSLGLSYIFMEIFFGVLSALHIHNRLAQTSLYASLFLVTPIFLLGQTVPLVSNYFSRTKLSEITGTMLFFSTAGSFLGSVFSTIVLMTSIGVHNTVIVTMGLLCVLIALLVRRWIAYEIWATIFVLGVVYLLNGTPAMQSLRIVSDNAYNTARINTNKDLGMTTLELNRSISSGIDRSGNNPFAYSKFFEDNLIKPLSIGGFPRDILVLGAGGFSAGTHDRMNHYTFVDIDKALKDIVEQHFIKQTLPPNKTFIAASARAFVKSDKNKYDLIFIDTYTNVISIPMETTTREFLIDCKALLKPGGILAANIIMTPDFRDKFSVRYDNTFASVFPNYSRQIVSDFSPWEDTNDHPKMRAHQRNIMYMYFDRPNVGDDTIYTDDKNTYSLDRD